MKNAFQIMVVTGLLAWSGAGQAQTLSMPDYLGRPGTEVVMPLVIDQAAGLAGMRVTVNFDPNILQLENVQRGTLGGVFDLVWQVDDGVLDLYFARDEALESGSGRLAYLKFRVNAGAATNLYSDLTIADFDLSDESGVVAVDRVGAVTSSRGRLTVTDRTQIDNTGNGLPDEWELAVGLDPFVATAEDDPDGDGLTNAQEAQLGFDPTKADTDEDGYPDRAEFIAGTSGTDGNDFLRLEVNPEAVGMGPPVFSWQSQTGRVYSVLRATNLLGLWPATPVFTVSGDGAEKSYTNENGSGSSLYYRLKVDLE